MTSIVEKKLLSLSVVVILLTLSAAGCIGGDEGESGIGSNISGILEDMLGGTSNPPEYGTAVGFELASDNTYDESLIEDITVWCVDEDGNRVESFSDDVTISSDDAEIDSPGTMSDGQITFEAEFEDTSGPKYINISGDTSLYTLEVEMSYGSSSPIPDASQDTYTDGTFDYRMYGYDADQTVDNPDMDIEKMTIVEKTSYYEFTLEFRDMMFGSNWGKPMTGDWEYYIIQTGIVINLYLIESSAAYLNADKPTARIVYGDIDPGIGESNYEEKAFVVNNDGLISYSIPFTKSDGYTKITFEVDKLYFNKDSVKFLKYRDSQGVEYAYTIEKFDCVAYIYTAEYKEELQSDGTYKYTFYSMTGWDSVPDAEWEEAFATTSTMFYIELILVIVTVVTLIFVIRSMGKKKEEEVL